MLFTRIYKVSDYGTDTNDFNLGDVVVNGVQPFLINVYFKELTSFDKQRKTRFIDSLKERYNNTIVNYINQRLLEEQCACIECYYIEAGEYNMEFSFTKNSKEVRIHNENVDFLCVSTHFDSTNRYEDAFAVLDEILKKHTHSYGNILRQWNYIPDICYYNEGKYEYTKFNEVRQRYYSNLSEYPAATGIGIGGDTTRIITFSFKSELDVLRLENTLQTPAFYYSHNKVDPNEEKPNCAKPLFARALLSECKSGKVLFISGTASIRGEESVADDVMTQLRITIENIEEIINKSNIDRQSIVLKVYLKNNILADEVLSAVKKHFDTNQVLVVQADVCRKELLIEIEAIVG